jgi:hypothetical protein
MTNFRSKNIIRNFRVPKPINGPGSEDGMATGYGLDGPGFESR